MGIADALDGMNQKVNARINKKKEKVSPEALKGFYRDLWSPFFSVAGRLFVLPVIFCTALMEGTYAGIKKFIEVMNSSM